jgi:hypothetical protein
MTVLVTAMTGQPRSRASRVEDGVGGLADG